MHRSSRGVTYTAYASMMLGLFLGVFAVAACVLAFLLMRREDPLYAAHGRYQLLTIGYAALALLLLMLVIKTAVGPFLLLAIKLWAIYRVIAGAYLLTQGRAPA